MSASVMDGGPQITKPWQNTTDYDASGSSPRLPQTHAVTGISRALTAPFPTVTDHRLPPISTTFDTRPPSRRSNISPAYSNTARSSRRQSLVPSPIERPDKRPRWQYNEPTASFRPFQQETDAYLPTPDVSAKQSAFLEWDKRQGTDMHRVRECVNCSDTQDLVTAIIAGLIGLESELKRAFTMSMETPHSQEAPGYEITKQGLKKSLMWASHSITSSSRIVRDVAVSQKSLPSLTHAVANVDPTKINHSKVTSTPTDHPCRPLDLYDKDRADDASRRHIASTPPDRSYRPFDTLPPISPVDQMKKAHAYDQGPQRPPHSPHRSSSGSIFGSMPSPMQSQQSSRTLPSPSAFQYPPSVTGIPGNYSPTHNQAAQTAHLQDLQHQISTKTLALQTLQREHDQLLAAFSRSQMRCTTLDTKSQVSDHEINSLTEEKIRLQQQVDAFEVQVEALMKSRDEAQERSAADGAQWQQIMTMSSQLQAKGIEESRRYKADREAWEHDRNGLQQRVQELEAGKLTLVASGRSAASTKTVSPDDILASASLELLREEIVRLRRSCARMEDVLQQIKGDNDEINQAMNTISNMRERIKDKMRHGLHESE